VILVDTSAWIEFDRATGSAIDERLAGLIGGQADLAVTEPVSMGLLAGARDDDAADRLRQMLFSFHWIPVEPATDFDAAARIYRACRAAGVAPRGLVDCLVATIALRAGATVLAGDRDFARIARVFPLRLDEATPR